MRHCRRRTGSHLLAVDGDLDVVGAAALHSRLAGAPTVRIVDLSAVRFIDAAGLRALLAIVEADPSIVIRAPSAPVRRLFEIVGLDLGDWCWPDLMTG